MNLQRGDVVLAWFPFSSGMGGKRRPCVVIQNDHDNRRLTNTIIVQITSNLARQFLPSQVFVEITTSEGIQTGLLHDSVISCNNIATIEQMLVSTVIGTLGPTLLLSLNAAMKNTFEIN